jgi:hypothetical protein
MPKEKYDIHGATQLDLLVDSAAWTSSRSVEVETDTHEIIVSK